MDELSALIRARKNDEIREMLKTIDPRHCVDFFDTQTTLLHVAAEVGNEVIAKNLLEMGVTVDAQDKHGNTAIVLAAKNKHYSTVNVILYIKFYRSVEQKELLREALDSVLGSADCLINVANFLTILRQNDNREANKLTSIIAYSAVCFDNDEVMRMLLQNGYPTDSVFQFGQKLLHIAFQMNKLKCAKVLLEYDADVDVKCKRGKIPIAYYDKCDDSDLELQVLEIIFHRAINLTTSSHCGEMQIAEFLKNGRKKSLMALLQTNIDLTVKDELKRTALHYLAMNSALSNEQDHLKLLYGKNLIIDAIDNHDESALSLAAMNGVPSLLQFLLDRNVRIKVRNSKEISLLHSVYRPKCKKNWRSKDYYRCSELLLLNGFNPQATFRMWKCKKCLGLVRPKIDGLINLSCPNCPGRKRSFFNETHSGIAHPTVLDFFWKDKDFVHTKLILAHLALLEARGTFITDQVRKTIDLHLWLSNQFNLCKLHLKRFQNTKVFECITLFDLMCSSDEKILPYLHKSQFMINLKCTDEKIISKSIYNKIFWDRLRKPLQIVEARKNATKVVSEVMGLSYEAHYIIIDKIVGYFWSNEATRQFLYI